MSRVALVCSEPLRQQMAGIGIRYLELARRLPRPGLEVVLVTSGEPQQVPPVPDNVEVRRFQRGGLARLLSDCHGAVAQGQLANDLLLEVPALPTAIDLYDPWLVENLHYTETLGLDPYRNDHATWVLQMSRGDFFLCSSEEQRQYYLGFLTALGRVNPQRFACDPDLRSLIAPVPFGVPDELPPCKPLLPAPVEGEKRILFGGLYDWYDPWTLLEALIQVQATSWRLLFIRNPNPEETPQRLAAEVERWCRRRGWWGERVQALDWIPAERRFDLLREVDLLVATHRPSLESRLSLRTRFLEAVRAECPVVLSDGGTMSRLVREWGAGWVVPPEDSAALAVALEEALQRPLAARHRQSACQRVRIEFGWPRVLEPLVRFCLRPERDGTKEEFGFRPSTEAPSDGLLFRLRRWHRVRWRRG